MRLFVGGGFVLLITTTLITSAMLTATVIAIIITRTTLTVVSALDFTSYKLDVVTVKGDASTFVKGELVPVFVIYKIKRIFDVDGWTLLAWLV